MAQRVQKALLDERVPERESLQWPVIAVGSQRLRACPERPDAAVARQSAAIGKRPGEPGGPPPHPVGGNGGGTPPCMAEFAKLREDVEKKGVATKEVSQRKVSREEMCKYVMTYAAAEENWVKFTVSGVQTCGIPAQVADQLKKVHSNTEQTVALPNID